MKRTIIIAEAGVNHNGDVEMARRLVDAAAQAGVDIVKFQTFVASRLVTVTAKQADYQRRATGIVESQLEMLRRLELNAEDHELLMRHCECRGIEFMSTGFDIQCVDLLAGLGQRRFKIPSGELTNLPYLRHVGRFGCPVILSTGMATIEEVGAAIKVLEEAGTPRSRLTVLHCTTEYPAPFEEVNLRAMQTLATTFGVNCGYSDHTIGIEVPIAAVAMGAAVIEKHLTLDRKLPGPDHKASLEPSEMAALVSAIRNVEISLGDGVKRVGNAEARNRDVARKSIVAARSIRSGEKFTEESLAAKRPGTGISPMRWDEVVGTVASRNFEPDDQITL